MQTGPLKGPSSIHVALLRARNNKGLGRREARRREDIPHSATTRPQRQRAIKSNHLYRIKKLAKVRLPRKRQRCDGEQKRRRAGATEDGCRESIGCILTPQLNPQSTPRRWRGVRECTLSTLRSTVAQTRVGIDSWTAQRQVSDQAQRIQTRAAVGYIACNEDAEDA
jgi:hypothetical protein